MVPPEIQLRRVIVRAGEIDGDEREGILYPRPHHLPSPVAYSRGRSWSVRDLGGVGRASAA
jgi:hypothetical protein